MVHFDALTLKDSITLASHVDAFCVDVLSRSPDRYAGAHREKRNPVGDRYLGHGCRVPRLCVIRNNGEEVVIGDLLNDARVDWTAPLRVPKVRSLPLVLCARAIEHLLLTAVRTGGMMVGTGQVCAPARGCVGVGP